MCVWVCAGFGPKYCMPKILSKKYAKFAISESLLCKNYAKVYPIIRGNYAIITHPFSRATLILNTNDENSTLRHLNIIHAKWIRGREMMHHFPSVMNRNTSVCAHHTFPFARLASSSSVSKLKPYPGLI